MVGQNISLRLQGKLWIAFQIFCRDHEYKSSREGVEGLIRLLPQYHQLADKEGASPSALLNNQASASPQPPDAAENNHTGDRHEEPAPGVFNRLPAATG